MTSDSSPSKSLKDDYQSGPRHCQIEPCYILLLLLLVTVDMLQSISKSSLLCIANLIAPTNQLSNNFRVFTNNNNQRVLNTILRHIRALLVSELPSLTTNTNAIVLVFSLLLCGFPSPPSLWPFYMLVYVYTISQVGHLYQRSKRN